MAFITAITITPTSANIAAHILAIPKAPSTRHIILIPIAKYIYDEYSHMKTVSWDDVCKALDVHPIFPSDGFKNEIKKELGILGVKITKGMVVFPSRTIRK